jgi:purine-nucleoside phosphorylase
MSVRVDGAFGGAEARVAADAVRAHIGGRMPTIAIILGSGLGSLVHALEDAVTVPFKDVPGFPSATVLGHQGALIAGSLDGRDVLALAGRFHMYEGHDARLAAFPVRVLHALGARTLFVSNAAGGVRRTLRPGDLMLIRDHINFMFRNPLMGAAEPNEHRFPDMSDPYDSTLCALALDVAREQSVPLSEGVYCGLLGPTYETPAEVRMLSLLGADAIGMSTVPEVLTARALEMRVLGVSCITNLACGLSAAPISHAEVIETTTLVAEKFQRLVRGIVARL